VRGTAAQLQDLLAGWQLKYPEVQADTGVAHAHPARLLAGASASADLVVLGRRGTGAHGIAVNSITHAVLSHAHGPVAVVAGG
jgi:nucleotide-binding universal stress UspA family protein